MAVNYDVLATTLYKIIAAKGGARDNMFTSVPLLSALKEKGRSAEEDGGHTLSYPVALLEHSTGVQFSNGDEVIPASYGDSMRQATFRFTDYGEPVYINGRDERDNEGKAAIVNIATARTKIAMMKIQREWEKQVVAKSSTVWTELESLNGIDAATGWLEEAAFGSQTNTVGGLAKSSYTATWQNQIQNASSLFASNNLEKMYALRNSASMKAEFGGVDIILASPLSFGIYQASNATQIRYTTKDNLGPSRANCEFAGATMYLEPNLPYVGATNTLSMYFLNSDGFKAVFQKGSNFVIDPFEKLSGQDVKQALVRVRTQLMCEHLASQGVLLNAEA